jgi:hypothetical protein
VSLDARLRKLELQAEPVEPDGPIRMFSCDGSATDGGPPEDKSVPQRPGVWAMRICGCSVEPVQGCRLGSSGPRAPDSFTLVLDGLERDYVGVGLGAV